MGTYLDFNIVLLQKIWLEKGNERKGMGKLNKEFNCVAKAAERINYEKITEWKFGLKINKQRLGKGGGIDIVVVYNNRKVKEQWLRN